MNFNSILLVQENKCYRYKSEYKNNGYRIGGHNNYFSIYAVTNQLPNPIQSKYI